MNGAATIALLWKEFRQLLSICLAISVCAILGFMIAALLDSMIPFNNPLEFFRSVVPAALTPITIALAGAVISIGAERQVGNWQWLTTLPVMWKQAFIAKLLAIFLMATLFGFIVLGVLLAFSMFTSTPLKYEMGLDGYDYRLMLFATPIAFLWSLIMCLCFREPMISIMLAAVITLVQGLVKKLLLGEFVSETAPTDFGMMAIATTVESLALLGIAVACFRVGWWDHEPILSSLFHGRLTVQGTSTTTKWSTWHSPNRFKAMLWQSLQAHIWPTLILAILSLLLMLTLRSREEYYLIPIFFLPSILGIFTFSGEQSRKQYRVIADRGIHPIHYLFMRILFPLALILLTTTLALASFRVNPVEQPFMLFPLTISIYFSFVLATMTFANPILAFFSGLAMWIALFQAGYSLNYAGGMVALPIIILLSLIALLLPCLLVRRWMHLENAHLPWITSGSLLAICATAFSLYAPLRAYAVPKLSLPAKSANTSLGLSPFGQSITESRATLSNEELEAVIELLRTKQNQTTGAYELAHRIEYFLDIFQANILANPVSNSAPSTDGRQEDSKLTTPDSITPTAQLKSLDEYRDILKKRLIQDMNPSDEMKANKLNDISSGEVWLFQNGRADYTKWLIAVIYIGMIEEDTELVTGGMKMFTQVFDPRYPREFNPYQGNSVEDLAVVLGELKGIASPKMYAIIFVHLIANVPDANVWKDFCIDFASLEKQLSRMDVLPAYEEERLDRAMTIQALYAIEESSQIVREMTSIHLSQLNRSKEKETTDLRVLQSTQFHPNGYFHGPSALGDLRNRLQTEFYGSNYIFYFFTDVASPLRKYARLISLAASGTTTP